MYVQDNQYRCKMMSWLVSQGEGSWSTSDRCNIEPKKLQAYVCRVLNQTQVQME